MARAAGPNKLMMTAPAASALGYDSPVAASDSAKPEIFPALARAEGRRHAAKSSRASNRVASSNLLMHHHRCAQTFGLANSAEVTVKPARKSRVPHGSQG